MTQDYPIESPYAKGELTAINEDARPKSHAGNQGGTRKPTAIRNSVVMSSVVWTQKENDANDVHEYNLSARNPNLSASLMMGHSTTMNMIFSDNMVEEADELGKLLEEPFDQHTKNATSIKPPFVSYEAFMWTWFLILSFLAIYDRFDWNVWPRQKYRIGRGGAGGDQLVGYKTGPWSVVLYDVIARISGRYSIVCYNFMLLVVMGSLQDLIFNSFISKYILDCKNMVNANVRLHTYNGIALCVLTLLHVWSILFPCIFHGYTVKVFPGTFEWPLSERTPIKCYIEEFDGCWPGDANAELEQMGLQVDDVFRMVEMTLFLAILMPLSIKWLSVHWHAAIQLHRLINIVYFVDIVRRHTHPHSWILNTPMFVIYVIDKFIYRNYWKRNDSPEVKKVVISKDFMVLYFKSPMGLTNTVGPDYALRLKNSSFFEEKHVFTCFENRSKTRLGDEADDFDWTVGVLIRVFRRARIPAILTDSVSHTERMFNDDKCDMLVTGPRQGEMSETLRYALYADNSSPVVIFGAGSAINFIIDTLQFCIVNHICRSNVSILYSTRDLDLFEWATEAISSLVHLCEEKGIKFKLTIACTGDFEKDPALKASLLRRSTMNIKSMFNNKILSLDSDDLLSVDSDDISYDADKSYNDDDDDLESLAPTSLMGRRSILRNTMWYTDMCDKVTDTTMEAVSLARSRIDLRKSIPDGDCTVFCQGSAGLKDAVKSICKEKGATYYLGRGGSREDQV